MGDSRFQRYCKSNPRKMVKLWAEKEMRNLARLHAAGINCPKPVQLRMHVLGEPWRARRQASAMRASEHASKGQALCGLCGIRVQ